MSTNDSNNTSTLKLPKIPTITELEQNRHKSYETLSLKNLVNCIEKLKTSNDSIITCDYILPRYRKQFHNLGYGVMFHDNIATVAFGGTSRSYYKNDDFTDPGDLSMNNHDYMVDSVKLIRPELNYDKQPFYRKILHQFINI